MPGLAGWISREPVGDPPAVLGRMAAEVAYAPEQGTHVHLAPPLHLGWVDHGPWAPPVAAVNEDGSVRLWLSGEVFGWVADAERLAREGHHFADPSSGPEYAVHLYEERGPDFLLALNGAFSLLVHDARQETFLLAVDRFASRPLYYAVEEGRLVFGSSARSVHHAVSSAARQYDDEALVHLFLFRTVKQNRTLCQGIRSIPAGARGIWQAGRFSITRYFAPRFDKKHTGSLEEGARELAWRLRTAVRLRTADSRPTGLFLSGGIDSRTVLAAAAPERLIALTLGERACEDLRVARRLARAAGARLTRLTRDESYYVRLIDGAARLADGLRPYTHAHTLGLHGAVRATGVEAVMSGMLFGTFFKAWMWLTPAALARAESATGRTGGDPARRIGQLLFHEGLCHGLPMACIRPIFAPRLRHLADALAEDWIASLGRRHAGASPRSLVDWAEREVLADLQASELMAFRLALARDFLDRTPTADNDVLDFACRMPLDWKAGAPCLRRALWHLDRRLALIPEATVGLPVYLPPLLDRTLRRAVRRLPRLSQALGCSVVRGHRMVTHRSWHRLHELIRQSPAMQERIEAAIRQLGGRILDVAGVGALLQRHQRREGNFASVFEMVLTLAAWDRDFGG